MAQPTDILDRPLTQRDLDHTPDDGNRYEVIDGVLYVSPFASYAHQEAAGQLFSLLNHHVRARGLGKVFTAGLKVVLGEPTGVGPDVVFVSAAKMSQMKPDGFYGPPDLLVEVLSTKPDLDRVVKANKYAEAGVAHYWIVDPVRRCLSAYALEGGHYRLAAELGGDATFLPALFPGLRIALAELWVEP